MKKKLLFVIESLTNAGAEKSLVTFLSILDYSKYEVDLQLFSYGGAFECYIPKEVNLLPPFDYTRFLGKNTVEQFLTFDFKKILSRWTYSVAIRLRKAWHSDKARLYWKYVSSCLPTNPTHYDVTIAYSQGIPTFYVAQKTIANKKMAWVNVGYKLTDINQYFQEPFYRKMDYIIPVSESAKSIFQQTFPQFSDKMIVIWDMLDAKIIQKLSYETPLTPLTSSVPNILTIARLNKFQKGYDISLEACKILKERKIEFQWYAIGQGPYRKEMEKFIHLHHLEDTFIFLGTTSNPYPYIKSCTLYVQTSRHEGFGLSIAEARILNKPIVTTEFDAVYNQIVPGKNGLVVPLENPVAVADAIERLLNDKKLYQSIVTYQQQEKKGNTEEIQKFYRLIEAP
ncbi:glycosyltransferase [Phocaeicola sartorii]|uniref:glycosyltransferase n=1 Tax=Phocaeicola sartorii TaxID=671267 RepID=UPI0013635039|nr:glycosyltransferase [Phocaeicola sartorii]NBH67401.1 glycosyltransferase [Phocaeicola sartorii]